MKSNSYIRTTCRLCGSNHLIEVLHLEPIPLPDEYVTLDKLKIIQPSYPLNLNLCKRCGHVQTSDVVNPKIIYKNYIYESVSSLGLIEHFEEYAQDVYKSIKPKKEALVIDIGSNDGMLLQSFKNLGLKVLGVDPAVNIARNATKKGLETLPEYFTQKLSKRLLKEYGPATVITANNIVANIDDLDEFILGVRNLLSKDGVFIMESFYLMDLMKNMVFDFIYHEHISSFTVKPLQQYFKKMGMELINVKHVPTKGGSLRYVVQLNHGIRKISPNVYRMIDFESKFGIHHVVVFKSFEKKINNAKNDLQKLISGLENQKKSIAGYGASATSTTLIYHFKLQKVLKYLIDDYKRKQNTYSPGCHIPVISGNEIVKHNPDYIVILAWRYAKQIVNNHKEFLRNGGKFIIPLPKLKIIKK
jgi:hypothetical protein